MVIWVDETLLMFYLYVCCFCLTDDIFDRRSMYVHILILLLLCVLFDGNDVKFLALMGWMNDINMKIIMKLDESY